jgi:peptidylprolyl isomerase
MNRRRPRLVPALSFATETLEKRLVLSTANAATVTALTVHAGTLGQATTFNVTVHASASAGSPQGTVELFEQGKLIDAIPVVPTTSPVARQAASSGSFTLTPQPGGASPFFGKQTVKAEFIPSGSFAKSTTTKTYTITQPTFTPLANGVKIATVQQGSGAALQNGETAGLLYTGYLAKNGQIFDDSINDGGTPFSFVVGAGQVIPGFDAGVVGMKVGETRIVEIPPSQGYGAEINGMIPANSTLIFVMTLESITPAATTTTSTTTG